MAVRELVQPLRRLVPAGAVPLVARARYARVEHDAGRRERDIAAMRLLLGDSRPPDEIQELADKHAQYRLNSAERRWHAALLCNQRVESIEILADRDQSKAVVLTFMHHGYYAGLFGSLAAQGVVCDVVVDRMLVAPDAVPWMTQHIRVVSTGGTRVIDNTVGFQGLVDAVRPGVVLAIACDMPGRTPIRFLDQSLRGSSAAARIAHLTGAAVVPLTTWRDGDGFRLRLEQPLQPADFASAEDLLQAVLDVHEPAVAAAPDAVEDPHLRWGWPT
ncbi:hypothetical protein [uncultured Jatrophihabitans sp.]|uniref:LpxL/LpxP family acyltransferase n=1 Tax=uncultured Jatrophihabitans sp. TaxID=1610747 RepID=UPI0035C99BD6